MTRTPTAAVWLTFAVFATVCPFDGLRADDSSNGLAVSADVVMMDPSDHKTATIILHLVNTSDHEITVLTKGLDFVHSQVDGEKPKVYACTVGYLGRLAHEGHPVVPSLGELWPVTLKPNEEAQANVEWDDDEDIPSLIKSKMPIQVTYTISDTWGKRLGIWAGSAMAKAVPIMPFSGK